MFAKWIFSILTLLSLSSAVWADEESVTVMVLLEAKPGCEQQLKEALLFVAECSRQESHCFNYQVFQDNHLPNKFGLFETWQSKELHLQQFSKPYIKEFIELSRDLLVLPYHSLSGHELSS